MRAPLRFTLSLLLLLPASRAYADKPTVAQCLSATETSLKLRDAAKLRAARAQLLVCSAASCPREVRQECTHRIDDLNAAIPSIVFTVKSGAGDDLSAVKVTMDGEVIADHLDGTALVLDPGAHEFTFEVPGQPPTKKSLVLHEAEKNRRESVVIGPVPPPPVVAAPAAPPAPVETPPESHAQRNAGLVVGSVGIAGLIVGGVFGGLTFSTWSSAKGECPTGSGCSSDAISQRSAAVTDGTVSTISFIAGGALAATGLIVLLTAPKGQTSAKVGVSPGGLSVSGAF